MAVTPAADRPIGFGRLKRKEDARFIRGQGTYLDDIKLPGMVYGAVLRSPYAHARIVSIDTTAALQHPRVHAVITGSDLEARSRMLLAAHYAGVGQQSGTGVGAVHAIGHAIGARGRLPHGTALATVMPEVFETYLGIRDRELALVAVALGVADSRDPQQDAARAGIDAVRRLLERVGQRRTLAFQGIGAEMHETIAQDAVDDAAINNSPRIPTAAEISAILVAVSGA